MVSKQDNDAVIDAMPEGKALANAQHSLVDRLPIIGNSEAIRRVVNLAGKVAPTDSNVLITGETGTGKELLARSIHALSPRRSGPFVAVNTGAIPENLQESELFGHRKGSFTGATGDHRGLFEEAEGGTLFLDEIGETSPTLQVKLLRALETRRVRRVGESQERMVDVRLVAATHRDLAAMVRRGAFREDLFFRLNVVQLHLPSLRERGDDLDLFLEHYLDVFRRRLAKKTAGFDDEAMERLQSYTFPGNIRELENVVHHCVLMADGDRVGLHDLPPYLQSPAGLPAAVLEAPSEFVEARGASLDLGDGFVTISEMERKLIIATLDKLKGNQSLAAKKLGISRSTLWRKMKEHKVAP